MKRAFTTFSKGSDKFFLSHIVSDAFVTLVHLLDENEWSLPRMKLSREDGSKLKSHDEYSILKKEVFECILNNLFGGFIFASICEPTLMTQ